MTPEETQANSRPRSLGGRRALVGLLFIVVLSLLWWHSIEHCDALAIFGPGGKAGGIVFFQGDIWLVMTNIDAGEPWTAQTVSASPEDGQSLRMLLADNSSTLRRRWTPTVATRWRFFAASQSKDAFGIPGKWCSTAGGPVWALMPLGILPTGPWIFRRGRLWRRQRRGSCPACGYDLSGSISTARCPECGETSPTSRSPNHAGT